MELHEMELNFNKIRLNFIYCCFSLELRMKCIAFYYMSLLIVKYYFISYFLYISQYLFIYANFMAVFHNFMKFIFQSVSVGQTSAPIGSSFNINMFSWIPPQWTAVTASNSVLGEKSWRMVDITDYNIKINLYWL